MKKADNDNTDTWISLAAATANVVRYLAKDQHPHHNDNRPADDGGAKQPETHPSADAKYVEHRLRELAAWERRIGGKKN
jgi:hypothetical protein